MAASVLYCVCTCSHQEPEHGRVSRLCARCGCREFWPARAARPPIEGYEARFSHDRFCLCGHVADFEHGPVSRLCLICDCRQFRAEAGIIR
jgi:hypothetical protein